MVNLDPYPDVRFQFLPLYFAHLGEHGYVELTTGMRILARSNTDLWQIDTDDSVAGLAELLRQLAQYHAGAVE